MYNIDEFKERFSRIKGKTIAIVYIFEGDDDCGLKHFYIWKSNIIAKWMNAVQELSCMPLIIDVKTFIDKAINKTLPHIDYVLNLNSGTFNLSAMALVPSMCSAINVPCIPCDAVSIVTGENKLLSNHIAASLGLNVPQELDTNDKNGIFRPISLGNSLGVQRGYPDSEQQGIYQEFIEGYEITTPVVYNALEKKMEVLPTVVFAPLNNNPEWYYGATDKHKQQGYEFKLIKLDKKIERKYIELVNTLSIRTFCRIDARVKCCDKKAMLDVLETGTAFDDIYFVEINVMPTIRDNNSFCYSFQAIEQSASIGKCVQLQKEMIGTINIHSFLLASSMMAFTP